MYKNSLVARVVENVAIAGLVLVLLTIGSNIFKTTAHAHTSGNSGFSQLLNTLGNK